LVLQSEVQSFIEKCMVATGAKPSHAKSLADVLVEGDCRGHYSHGLNRMDMYVKDIQTGICSKDGEPVIEKESVATALVNGENVLGPVVGNFCMDLAIKKAKDVGIGWVVAKGSNHYGIAGYYAMQALKQDMIGMSYTNTSPLVVPTRARDVELHHRSGDTIPEGWGCDSHGKPSTDPGKVLSGGGLLPIGGCEATGGYKGFGLGMMVEVFCGILAGSHYSKHIRTWKVTDSVANLAEPGTPVMVPGDPERINIKRCKELGGLSYHINVINHMVREPLRMSGNLGDGAPLVCRVTSKTVAPLLFIVSIDQVNVGP
ncbi:UNVERIFIED_CONTAM: hypothetical protein FKN15_057680, partial [Acipenser sinensis]